MELKRYLMILLRWWWLVLVALVTVVAASLVFTYTRPPEYETTVRFIVSPAATTTTNLGEQRASLSALSNKPVVANTYAEVAQSASTVEAAWEQLGTPPARRKDFEVRALVLHNTNILVITVAGPDPALVQQLATAVSQHTLDYVAGLYEVYDLKLLDPAALPDEPISPNKSLNIALGVVLGLGVGVTFAFLAEYLKTPLHRVEQMSIVDAQTGAYKGSYLLRRLREEIIRSQRVQRPFVVGVIRLEDLDEMIVGFPAGARQVILRQVVHILRQTLSEENLVAQWREGDIALLMPDCDSETARKTVERLRTKLVWTPFEIGDTGFKLNLTARFGLAEYSLNGIDPEALLDRAEKALQDAENEDGATRI